MSIYISMSHLIICAQKSGAPFLGTFGLGCEICQYANCNIVSCARTVLCCAGALYFSRCDFETLCPEGPALAQRLWWYISPVAACFLVQPGVGRQGCSAPPFSAARP